MNKYEQAELFVAGILNVISDGLQHTLMNVETNNSMRIYRCSNGDIVLGDEILPAKTVRTILVTMVMKGVL